MLLVQWSATLRGYGIGLPLAQHRCQIDGLVELTELLAGFTPAKALVESVYSRTQSNALFVTEVVRLLMREGAAGSDLKSDPAQDIGASWSLGNT